MKIAHSAFRIPLFSWGRIGWNRKWARDYRFLSGVGAMTPCP
jgi:hypothetical protein